MMKCIKLLIAASMLVSFNFAFAGDMKANGAECNLAADSLSITANSNPVKIAKKSQEKITKGVNE